EGRIFIHRDSLRLAVWTGDFNLGAVNGFDFTHNEVLAHTFAEIVLHAGWWDCHHFGLHCAVTSFLSADKNVVSDFEVGELRVLAFLAETGLISHVDRGGTALHGFQSDGIAADGDDGSSNAGATATTASTPLATLLALR